MARRQNPRICLISEEKPLPPALKLPPQTAILRATPEETYNMSKPFSLARRAVLAAAFAGAARKGAATVPTRAAARRARRAREKGLLI